MYAEMSYTQTQDARAHVASYAMLLLLFLINDLAGVGVETPRTPSHFPVCDRHRFITTYIFASSDNEISSRQFKHKTALSSSGWSFR